MKLRLLFLTLLFAIGIIASAQTITIAIDATSNVKPISSGIYGKNNCLSDDPNSPLSTSDWKFLKDAGIRLFRENGGNNATKYNWRLKLSSHPDWYNNVYSHNWDYSAQQLQTNIPDAYGMYAFQMIGKVAATTKNNFNDWNYNSSSWWEGVSQNLAGGGTPNTSGGSAAAVEGDPELYLTDWNADSTTAILDHWFGNDGLGLNAEKFLYWNMDNEPEIWNGTHDDVMPTQPTAEELMQRYFEVAKKARALYPGIKLCGPVTCNEWQWYNYNSNLISSGGKKYTWLEYFIKRVAEEQIASGIRLLDVIDLHFYPGETADSDVMQLYRVFFDKYYLYPGANGCKTINGSWDDSQKKEYVFERCRAWLETYMGADNGVTFGLSELGCNDRSASVNAVAYASILGTFANNEVEFLTPWTWLKGMYETVHLFSCYSHENSCSSVSSDDNNLSAYTSLNSDSMTIIVVNRSSSKTYTTNITISNSMIPDGTYKTLQLKELPSSESFKSHTSNALVSNEIPVANNCLSLSAPPVSITAILLKADTKVSSAKTILDKKIRTWQGEYGNIMIQYCADNHQKIFAGIYDINGRLISSPLYFDCNIGTNQFNLGKSKLPAGIYIVRLTDSQNTWSGKLFLDE